MPFSCYYKLDLAFEDLEKQCEAYGCKAEPIGDGSETAFTVHPAQLYHGIMKRYKITQIDIMHMLSRIFYGRLKVCDSDIEKLLLVPQRKLPDIDPVAKHLLTISLPTILGDRESYLLLNLHRTLEEEGLVICRNKLTGRRHVRKRPTRQEYALPMSELSSLLIKDTDRKEAIKGMFELIEIGAEFRNPFAFKKN